MLLSACKTLKLRVQSLGAFRYFSAQSHSTTKNSSCIPWQYCRTHGLDFPTSSAITGVDGAADRQKPAAAKPPCLDICVSTLREKVVLSVSSVSCGMDYMYPCFHGRQVVLPDWVYSVSCGMAYMYPCVQGRQLVLPVLSVSREKASAAY